MASRTKKDASEKPVIPDRIFANASPHSVGGVSLFAAGEQINERTVANFSSESSLIRRAVEQLRTAGFEILQISSTTINIVGSAETYQRAFGREIIVEERPVIKSGAVEDTAEFLEGRGYELPGFIPTRGTSFADLLEGVALEEPRYYMSAAPAPVEEVATMAGVVPLSFPPMKAYWHLRVPGDVSLACNADQVHRTGITGQGIKVAMVDSGWYKHPFFVARGYRAAPVVLGPAAANPLVDESGHGTGESANIFALAPDVELLPVKMNFVNTLGAFNAAVGLNPQIITCSWGSDKEYGPLSAGDQALAAAVATAVAAGIAVIFSAGNGHFGFPGQHPDVIAAGGTYMEPSGALRASDYASGFMSNIYPNRRVPDLCGLVGMQPKAAYIMLPVEPGDDIDRGLQGGTHPTADETTGNDGWAAFSGTSAAAPQLAGAAALIRQACPRLSPTGIRDVLMKAARDVATGNCHPRPSGAAATIGPDTATGAGLVDAHKAVLLAKIRCLGPVVQPRGPIRPIEPIRSGPIEPIRGPIEPIRGPIEPIRSPIEPIRGPIEPIRQPPEPIRTPSGQALRGQEDLASTPATSGAPGLTAEDVAALENMVMHSELRAADLDTSS